MLFTITTTHRVSVPLPLEIRIAGLPCRGGETVLRQLFEPLGYAVEAEQLPLDPLFPQWGGSRYFNVMLRANATVHDALSHVYVLVPALDGDKHYWVGDDEVEKLPAPRRGLAGHASASQRHRAPTDCRRARRSGSRCFRAR